MDHVGERIRELRKKLKLTQEELAGKMGVSRTTVISWEKGKFAPERQNTIDLASALETTTSYLMGETNNPSPIKTKHQNILISMREQTELSIKEASKLINLPPEDLEMMEENEHLADDVLKQKLIKAYGKYLSHRDGENDVSENEKNEEDLENLLKMLAGEDPDLVLQFRHVAKNIDKIHPKDKEFLATLFKAALGKIELEDHTDEY